MPLANSQTPQQFAPQVPPGAAPLNPMNIGAQLRMAESQPSQSGAPQPPQPINPESIQTAMQAPVPTTPNSSTPSQTSPVTLPAPGATISKDMVKQILAGAPQGVAPTDIVNALLQKGYNLEGYQGPQPSVSGFLGNAVGSIGNLAGNTVSAIVNAFNPNLDQNSLVNIARLGAGLAENVVNLGARAVNGNQSQPFNDKNTQIADNLASALDDRWGINDIIHGNIQGALQKIGNTLYTDPAGAALDMSMFLGGVGSAMRGAGTIGELGDMADIGKLAYGGSTEAAIKAASESGQLGTAAKVGQAISNVGEAINPFEVTGKLASVLTKPITDYITTLPDKLYDSALGTTQKMLIKGKSPSSFLADQGIWGSLKSIYNQVQTGMDNTKEIIDAKLAATPGEINTADIITKAKEFITNKFQGAYTPEEIDTAFGRLPIADLVNNKTLSFSDANSLRQTLDKIIGSPYFLSDAAPALSKDALNSVSRTLSNAVKDGTDTAPEFKAMSKYIETMKLLDKKLAQATRMTGKIPLKEIALGGVGGFVGGVPGMVAGAILEQMSESPFTKTGIAQLTKGATEAMGNIPSVNAVPALSGAAYAGRNNAINGKSPTRRIRISR